MSAPGFKSFSISDVAYLVDGQRTVQGSDVVMASGQASGITPDHRHPPGTVVVKESGNGKYYLASGADGASAGDINTTASLVSDEAADTDWDGTTITAEVFYADGTTASAAVTLAGTDDSTSEVVTALNGNAAFANHFVASGADAAVLTIASRVKGNVRIKVTSSLASAFGASGKTASGTEADYRVTADFAELKTTEAVAQDYAVPTLLAGHFRESALSGLTAEAKSVLLRRGSLFS
jgi:hypothetical protein